jgi:subtilisin family serine protease
MMLNRQTLAFVLAPFALATAALSPCAHAGDDEPSSDRAAIALASPSDLAAFLAQYPITLLDEIPSAGLILVMLDRVYERDEFESLVESDPRVVWADLDFDAGESNGGSQSFFTIVPAEGFVNQPARFIVGLPPTAAASTGRNVVVAVIDTGADVNHPELVGRTVPGYNVLDDSTNVADIGVGEFAGHGTFISALVLSFATDSRVLPIRAMDASGQSTTWFVAKGIYKAIELGADIVNISLGSNETTEILDRATQAAHDAGVLVVAAAGNSNTDSPLWIPAAIETVIGVAATDNNDFRAPFSNYGQQVDISVPGVDIISAMPGAFAQSSGTSWSTAIVSAGAAIVRQQIPAASVDLLRERLLTATVNIDDLNPDYQGKLGAGRLDLASVFVCSGDLNADMRVDFEDLNFVLSNFGVTAGFTELNAVLSGFSSDCSE